jgi:hypothetical protein
LVEKKFGGREAIAIRRKGMIDITPWYIFLLMDYGQVSILLVSVLLFPKCAKKINVLIT